MNDFESLMNEGVDFYRICFSIETLILKETMSKKMVRELLHLPYCYQYDNQIQFLVSYDKYPDRSEASSNIQI